ncbi:hypothetical protein HRbin21_01595 [bacterium HR21]|jgi:hypothetical protein|nr:hypothetical protein HRbin21_01595 [bacterium HR21]
MRCVLLWLGLATGVTTAAPDTLPTRSLWLEFSAELGMLLSWEGTEFLQSYRELTHATTFPTTFPPGEALTLGLRVPLDSCWKFRLGVGLWQLQLDHTDRQWLQEEQRQGERVVRAVLHLRFIPVWLGAEWHPFSTQFRSYLHAAVGIIPLKFLWQETVRTSVPEDVRSGGIYRKQWLLRPGIRLGAGTALRFDAAARGSLLESLRAEVGYSFIPVRDTALEPLSSQLPSSAPLRRSFWLSGSMLTLSLALVLQLPMLLP